MSKTLLTLLTALLITVLSVFLILGRTYVLGNEIDGSPGVSAWKVTLEVKGELHSVDGSVTTTLPPDFRRQHILDETFQSAELSHRAYTTKEGGRRKVVWRARGGAEKPGAFRLAYSFRCIMGMRRPSPGMVQRTRVLDAAPTNGRDTKPGPLVQSEHPEILALAAAIVQGIGDEEERLRALYAYVADLPEGEAADALSCLREASASNAGRARLLAALCRSRKIPARIVSGLFLKDDGQQPLQRWVEAWVEQRWLSMDPSRQRFGAARFGDDYLVLLFGDGLVQSERASVVYTLTARDLHNALDGEGEALPSLAKRIWRKMTLGNLRPEEQFWMKFLLLLPVGALVVSVFRTIIGIPTFGTFGPALLGLVCRDPRDFPWALGIFVGIMLAGWILRRILDHYHLLLVPRLSVLLTSIIILLTLAAMLLGPYAGATHGYVALLPLIILTHMIERFWTVETEDSTPAAFRMLLGTVTVAVVVTLLVNFDIPVNALMHALKHEPAVPADLVRTTLFRYPESLGLVLAAQLVIGRYTGYRLTELFRFRDLVLEEPLPERNDESPDARPPA